jgi:hypothetical protein
LQKGITIAAGHRKQMLNWKTEVENYCSAESLFVQPELLMMIERDGGYIRVKVIKKFSKLYEINLTGH